MAAIFLASNIPPTRPRFICKIAAAPARKGGGTSGGIDFEAVRELARIAGLTRPEAVAALKAMRTAEFQAIATSQLKHLGEITGLDRAVGKLRAALGDPAWAADERFATAEGRRAHHDDLDAGITAWTSTRTHRDAADHLQAHGVPADLAIDRWVTIPHTGRSESLNAAMAASLSAGVASGL